MQPARAAPAVPLVYQPLCWRPSICDNSHCGALTRWSHVNLRSGWPIRIFRPRATACQGHHPLAASRIRLYAARLDAPRSRQWHDRRASSCMRMSWRRAVRLWAASTPCSKHGDGPVRCNKQPRFPSNCRRDKIRRPAQGIMRERTMVHLWEATRPGQPIFALGRINGEARAGAQDIW
jgi:hypothetical protein